MTALGVAIPPAILAIIGLGSGILLLMAVVDLLKGKLDGAIMKGVGFILTALAFTDGMTAGKISSWLAEFLAKIGNQL